ncbi:MAG: polyprenyl synthetase family protein [Bacteroidota bacterium]
MIKDNLKEIRTPVITELDEFEKIFKDSLKSKVGLVDLVTKFILKQKGKKIRPLLVLLSAQLSGGVTRRSYRGASLVELLHTATLVHDDVVDGAEKRRGFPSINAIWKNKISVLMGDYLLSRGLLLAVEADDFDFLKVITSTVKRMSEGELLQIGKTRRLNIDEETYFRIISDKTASLLSTCCEIGALSASNNLKYIVAMREYGENLGMAFQIRDDILDYVGKSKLIGKPLGADIKDKKITLPLIHALSIANKSEAKEIIGYLKNGNKNPKVNEIIEFVKGRNGIEYSLKIAEGFALKAKASLNVFPDSASKTSLNNLVNFVVNRSN